MSFGQFFDCIKGHNRRMEAHYRQIDSLNHILGNYVLIAIHDGKHYPKHPYLEKSNSSKRRMTDEEMAESARRSAAQWKELQNGRSNHGR